MAVKRDPEMMLADEMDPKRRREGLMQARYNAEMAAKKNDAVQTKERAAQAGSVFDNMGTVLSGGTYNAPPFANRTRPLVGPPKPYRTGSDPAPTPVRDLDRVGRIGEVPFVRPSEPEPQSPAPAAPAPAPTAPQAIGAFGRMGDVKQAERGAPSQTEAAPMNPEMLALADTEQGRRDLAMLRKQRNIATAQLMGTSNPYSAFNPNNRNYSPDRGDLILEREMMNQQLATAERAANPPRYETDPTGPRATAAREQLVGNLDQILMNEERLKQLPGNQPGPVDPSSVDPRVDAFRQQIAPKPADPEMLLAQERATTRQQQAVAQANTDQGYRDTARNRSREIGTAEYERDLAKLGAERDMEKAGAEKAGVEAMGAKADYDLAKKIIPIEQDRAMQNALKAQLGDRWTGTVGSVVSAIAQSSGKAMGEQGKRMLDDALAQFDSLPDEAKQLAAVEIISKLEQVSPGLSLEKDVLERSDWRLLNWLTGTGALTETGLVKGNAVGDIAKMFGGGTGQVTINQFLQKLRGMRDNR